MTGYGVKIVGDDVLPDGVEWMFVKRVDGSLNLWLTKTSACSARVLSEAWAAYRSLEGPEKKRAALPEQRRSTYTLRIN